MTEQTLNESELLVKMSDAIANNKVEDLNNLFKDAPIEDSAVPESTPGPEVVDSAVDAQAGDTPNEKPEGMSDADWEASLPEEVRGNVLRLKEERENLIRELHRAKSDAGRVAAYQRQAQQAKRELEEFRKKQAQPQPQKLSAALGIETDEDFQKLVEADPTFARMFERQLKKVAEKVEETYGKQFQELQTKIASRDEMEFISREQERLLTAIPNVAEVVAHPAWTEFKNSAPEGVRALAESSRADDVIVAMRLYTDFVNTHYAPSAPVKEEPKQSATGVSPSADKIAEERRRKLEGGPGTSSSRPVKATDDPLDPEALLAKMYDQIRKAEGYQN